VIRAMSGGVGAWALGAGPEIVVAVGARARVREAGQV
jgi:hypothetical protein